MKIQKEALKQIEDRINDELLKRQFPNIKARFVEDTNKSRIVVQSNNFQTAPVIFKSIRVDNFNTSLTQEVNKKTKEKYIRCWISVHVFYQHFNGSANGVKLFDFNCKIYNNKIYEVIIA